MICFVSRGQLQLSTDVSAIKNGYHLGKDPLTWGEGTIPRVCPPITVPLISDHPGFSRRVPQVLSLGEQTDSLKSASFVWRVREAGPGYKFLSVTTHQRLRLGVGVGPCRTESKAQNMYFFLTEFRLKQ